MLRLTLLTTISISLINSYAFAMGGNGATCNPSTPNWGSCSLAPVPFQASVTNTVNIPAGHYATAYQANQANTEYILQGDITADGTAITVSASYVIINLNGHTITYNQTAAGEGVNIGEWNRHHVAVKNGTIIQSTANIGKITSISIEGGGIGYAVNNVLTLAGMGSANATARVTGVNGSGTITGIRLITPGSGYEVTYDFRYPTGYRGPVTGGSGTGAVVKVTGTISEGLIEGFGKSPVTTQNGDATYDVPDMHVSNLYLRYYGRDVGGIVINGARPLIEQTTIEDNYPIGTVKHRDMGVDALKAKGDYSIIRNNTLTNTRHRGINGGKYSIINGNNVSTRTIATNGAAISCIPDGGTIFSNSITARGEHALGIFILNDAKYPSAKNIYDNYIDSKTTQLGLEYGSAYLADPSSVIIGNGAVGFRTTWGGDGINFHDNEIHVSTDSNYTGTFSPTGATAHINARGSGLMVGIPSGETAYFSNNSISVLDKDGTGLSYGISCTSNFSDKLYFIGNTVTANVTNVAISDEYAECVGFPLFKGNTFIKAGNYAAYKTLSTQGGGQWNAEARVVENTYQNGASINSIDFHADGYGRVNVYFDSVNNGEYRYSYRLHDNDNTSSTFLREDFSPAITLGYENPAISPIGFQVPKIFSITNVPLN